MKRESIVTVFGSSRPREGDADYEEARELGRILGETGFSVCSGGYNGVMAAVSRGAKEAGAKTYGVTAEFFSVKVNPWIDEEIRVRTWEERLFKLVSLADGYIACKGGTGTLVELAVVWEMLNKAVMSGKPFAVLGNFWVPVIERVREVEMGHRASWSEANGRLVHPAPSPVEAVSYVEQNLGRGKASAARKQMR